MNEKYVIITNSGLYHSNSGKNSFTYDEVVEEIAEWGRGEKMLNEDEEEILFEDLFDNEQDVYCQNMVEMGDDFVTINIVMLD